MTRLRIAVLLLLAFACHRGQPGALGDPARGKEAMDRYGCVSCHIVPGFSGAKGMVGPSLRHFASRATIAGRIPNAPATVVKWLQNPQALDPQTSMPNLGITPDDARDIAAYLETLR